MAAAAVRPSTAAPSPPNYLSNTYLIAYNLMQICTYGYIDFLLARHFLASPLSASPWSVVELPLKFALTVSLLEIVHALVGLVRSNAATTALQGAALAVFSLCRVAHNEKEL
jgi:hypothetical protein